MAGKGSYRVAAVKGKGSYRVAACVENKACWMVSDVWRVKVLIV